MVHLQHVRYCDGSIRPDTEGCIRFQRHYCRKHPCQRDRPVHAGSQPDANGYAPSIDLFVEIAAFFDVTLDYLIIGKLLSDHEEHLRNKLQQKRLANQKLSLKLQRIAQNLAAIAEEL